MKITNQKFQIPNKSKITMTKIQNRFEFNYFGFVIYLLFGALNLVLNKKP